MMSLFSSMVGFQMKDSNTPIFLPLNDQLPLFLGKLRENNSRGWYHSNKDAYETHVMKPLKSLAEGLASHMVQIDSKISLKLSRPQRDTRFSANKSPYKTEAWFAYHREDPEWTGMPAYFFEVTPDRCRYGMGFYSAKPTTMGTVRTMIQQRQELFLNTVKEAEKKGFAVEGTDYKRPPVMPPEGTPEPIRNIYRKKNVYLCRVSEYEPYIFDSGLLDLLIGDFSLVAALYHLFLDARLRSVD
ncbi:MAG: DUF2461 domain-containing protein [Magnetococcales bacterium]|nr:DUF2461 domain-containing protein [Magnetococcales bacterium]